MKITFEDGLDISLALEDRANYLDEKNPRAAHAYRDLLARWDDFWKDHMLADLSLDGVVHDQSRD
jgi:hypothetical protein